MYESRISGEHCIVSISSHIRNDVYVEKQNHCAVTPQCTQPSIKLMCGPLAVYLKLFSANIQARGTTKETDPDFHTCQRVCWHSARLY